MNVFFTRTEYHLMVSIHLAVLNNSSSVIYILKLRNKVRLNNFKFNFFIKDNIEFRYLDTDDKLTLLNKKIACDNFFFFQENDIYTKYIAKRLHKAGAKIILLPDGNKPYNRVQKKHEFLSCLRNTVNANFSLYKSRCKWNGIFIADNYRYGSSSFIDEIWLTHPELFDKKHNRTKAKIVSFENINQKTISYLELFFCCNDNMGFNQNSDIILYLNQPFQDKNMVDIEFCFLNKVSSLLNKKVFIKLHPHTPEKTKLKYSSSENLVCFTSSYPAELLIIRLKSSIIISGWSAGLSVDNIDCSFYYIYPIFSGCKDKVFNQMHLCPFPHIKVVDNPMNIIKKR